MKRWGRRQSGELNLGCIIWAALLVAGIFVAFKMIPVKLASSEFYDYIEEQAKFAGGSSPEGIKKGILFKAKELELPVDENNVTVEKIGDRIRMKCAYTVPVDLMVKTYQWNFNFEVDRPIYIF